METETFVMLSSRLGYTNQAEAQPVLDLITEISKMLTVLRLRLTEGPVALKLLFPVPYSLFLLLLYS